jgi:ABC-2 type transport system permease protein
VLSLALIAAVHLVMLLLGTAVLLASGLGIGTLWPQLRFVPSPVATLYASIVVALWHAPIYGWLLLVSGWARRTPFLWALSPLAIGAFERIAFGSSHFASLLQYRFCGWLTQAYLPHVRGSVAIGALSALDPGKFLATPGLWIGLAFAAACLAAAVRLRRSRGPM